MSAPDEQQRRLARDALTALAGTDFALAGAGAIREHGITDRPTQDVDLFTANVDAARFTEAVDQLGAALTANGYTPAVLRRAPTFARLEVRTADGVALEVDLAADWRSADPVTLAIGPVLSLPDAVASKLDALYSRAETRDYLDVDAIRQSGRYSDAELLTLVADRDPGYDTETFVRQLRLVRQLSAAETERYGVTVGQLRAVQERISAWAEELTP